MKREFTGVFIPAHIWTSRLLPAEKMLLGEVASLSVKTGWCDASREHFAEWLHCDVTNVTHYVKKLEKLGFLEVSRTPGYRSKMRVVNDTFFVQPVVNPIHGGSEPHSRGVVNPIHGGSEPHSPEIQDKYNKKNEREKAPAPAQISSTLNTELPYEKKEVPPPPAAPILPPNWAARPKAHTADELRAELANFYRPYPEQWRATIDGTPAANWPADKTKDVVENFCAWAIGEGYNGRTFQQINARLKRWFKDEPAMSRQPSQAPANTSTTLPQKIKVYGN